jgi:hypothetical protein
MFSGFRIADREEQRNGACEKQLYKKGEAKPPRPNCYAAWA